MTGPGEMPSTSVPQILESGWTPFSLVNLADYNLNSNFTCVGPGRGKQKSDAAPLGKALE
jgi:hypothetical protein